MRRHTNGARFDPRGGFTLLEVVVAVMILTVMAAAVAAAVARRPRQAEASSLAQTLNAVSDAILHFRTDVRRYPTELRYLTTPPPGTAVDLCGRALPASFSSAWQGPYLDRAVSAAGLVVVDATMLNVPEKEPATFTTSTAGSLLIVVEGVDSAAADQLDRAFEGSPDLTSGTIRWTAASGGVGTLRYALPVRGC